MLPGTLMNNVLGSYRGVRVLPKKANRCFLSMDFSVFSGGGSPYLLNKTNLTQNKFTISVL